MSQPFASGWDVVPGFSADQQTSDETTSFRQGDASQSGALLESDSSQLTLGFAQLVALAASLGIVTASPAIAEIIKTIVQGRGCLFPVLITGETGTGKELIAGAVRALSVRREQPFKTFDCATASAWLIESELFGHKRGSFTGAISDRKGIVQSAADGTLFLDEIGELPLEIQTILLRLLQEGEVRPVGANDYVKIDVRVIAATNRDLEAEVRAGRFRRDLYERLNGWPLHIPPLRERREDIRILIEHFLALYQQEWDKQGLRLSDVAMELMHRYDWPGNVRQLQHEVYRLAIKARNGEVIGTDRLSEAIRAGVCAPPPAAALVGDNLVINVKLPHREAKDALLRLQIEYALKETGGNILRAAALIKMSRNALKKAIEKFEIEVEKYRSHKPRQ